MWKLGMVIGSCAAISCGPVLAQDFFDYQEPGLSIIRGIQNSYIIELDSSVDFEDVPAQARAMAARFNGRIIHTYGTTFRGFAVQMNDAAISRLIQSDEFGAISVYPDGIMTVSAPPNCSVDSSHPSCKDDDGGGGGDDTTACTIDELGWGTARVTTLAPNSDCSLYNDTAPNRFANKSDLKVCVIDTGVDTDHDDLNVSDERRNFSSDTSDDDLHGHGTHVAGTIGAIANLTGTIGVAPGTYITSIKVLNQNGSGTYSDVIKGIDESAAISCDVANLSLGGGRSSAVDLAVQCASGFAPDCSANTVMFAIAAGNDSTDTSNHSPAAADTDIATDGIFTVTAFAEGDSWASFSNYDADGLLPLADFSLPGVSIKSTLPGGTYGTYSGTSMAAPHMAGLIVRYLVDRSATHPIANDAFDTVDVDEVQRMFRRGNKIYSYEDYDVPVDDLLP